MAATPKATGNAATDTPATRRFLIHTNVALKTSEVAALARQILQRPCAAIPLAGVGTKRPVSEHFLLRVRGVVAEDVGTADAFDRAHQLREQSQGVFTWVEPDLLQRPSVQLDDDPDVIAALRLDRSVAGEIVSDFCMEKQVPPSDRYWHLRKLLAPQAWDYSDESKRPARGLGVRIGHLDTGWTTHPELFPSLDLVGQHDFVDDDSSAEDPLSKGNPFHGTRTGSVIASTIEGDIPEATMAFPGELAGVAPRARLVPIRVVKSVVVFFNGDVARGIRHAVSNDCHVISLSLGGVGGRALHQAVREAIQSDLIVCAAAGNCVRMVVWPARYAESIAVAATNANDRPWKGSSSGRDVDITAPGAQVWTAARPVSSDPRPVGQGEGTSFAVACVAGIAALWLAHHGRDTLIARFRPHGVNLQAVFRWILTTSARDVGLPSGAFGAGLADAKAVLRCPLPPPDVAAAAMTERVVSANSIDAVFADLLAPAPVSIRAAATASLRASADAAERDLLTQEFAQICFDHPNAHAAYSRGLTLRAAEWASDPSLAGALPDASGIAKYASARLRSRLVSR